MYTRFYKVIRPVMNATRSIAPLVATSFATGFATGYGNKLGQHAADYTVNRLPEEKKAPRPS